MERETVGGLTWKQIANGGKERDGYVEDKWMLNKMREMPMCAFVNE